MDVHNEVARLISSLPDEVREEVALGLTDELLREARGADRLVNKALFDKNTYYAIKRDDLSFSEEAVAIVTGLLAAPGNPLPSIGALVSLLLKYRRKRIRLDGDQGVVLLWVMRAKRGGWTATELTAKIPSEYALTEARVKETLQKLDSLGLVVKDAQRWEATEVV